jgi:hypothetical protein
MERRQSLPLIDENEQEWVGQISIGSDPPQNFGVYFDST